MTDGVLTVTVSLTMWQALAFLSAPFIAFAFFVLVMWADGVKTRWDR